MTSGLKPDPTLAKPVVDALDLDPRLHLAAIVSTSEDPIISESLDGRILSWNEAAARVFGHRAEEMVGHSSLELIPPELHREEEALMRRLREGEKIEHYETMRVRKNGEVFPVAITVSPIKDHTGRIVAASKIVRDITDKKSADESRFRLSAVVDSADDAIISKDLNGIVRSWNKGASRIFGYSAEEMIGQSILKLIPDDLRYEEDQILSKLRLGQRVEHYETRRKRKNGDIFDISVTISPIRDESGNVIGASKIGRDVSDKKQLEKVLIQSEKLAATGRMAATIAHEINNPLESLMNIIFLARQNSPTEGRVHALLLTAEQELERVSHIARQTLGYYRDTGAPTENFVHDLLENVLGVYQSKMLATGISVDSRFDDLQKVLVSKGEMLQVFSNVIANAIEAMRHGGSLNIATRNVMSIANDGIQVEIRDCGSGIAKENLARVFEPFFTTKGELGTGIGLWVAKRLVTRRGGQISVASSTSPGDSGTTVTIFIPFAYPSDSPESKDEPLVV